MFTQVVPGIDATLVSIIPLEVDGILADRIGRLRPQLGFVHWQERGGLLYRLSRLTSIRGALLRTSGARTRIPQPLKGILALMSVLPFNIHTSTGGDVYLD